MELILLLSVVASPVHIQPRAAFIEVSSLCEIQILRQHTSTNAVVEVFVVFECVKGFFFSKFGGVKVSVNLLCLQKNLLPVERAHKFHSSLRSDKLEGVV